MDIFDNPEWPLAQISRARHYSTLNISETVQTTDIVIQWNTNRNLHTHTHLTQRCNFKWPAVS